MASHKSDIFFLYGESMREKEGLKGDIIAIIFCWPRVEIEDNKKWSDDKLFGFFFLLGVNQNNDFLNQKTSFWSKHSQNTRFHLNKATYF